MRRRKVSILPEALNDLAVLYEQIAQVADDDIAFNYAERASRGSAKGSTSLRNVGIAAMTLEPASASSDFAAA